MAQEKENTAPVNSFDVAMFIINVLIVLNIAIGHIRPVELAALAAGFLLLLWMMIQRKNRSQTLIAKLPVMILMDVCMLSVVFSDGWLDHLNPAYALYIFVNGWPGIAIFLIIAVIFLGRARKKSGTRMAGCFIGLEFLAIAACYPFYLTANVYENGFWLVYGFLTVSNFIMAIVRRGIRAAEPDRRRGWVLSVFFLYMVAFFLLWVCFGSVSAFLVKFPVHYAHMTESFLRFWRMLILAVALLVAGFFAAIYEEDKNRPAVQNGADFNLFYALAGGILLGKAVLSFYHPAFFVMILVYLVMTGRYFRPEKLEEEYAGMGLFASVFVLIGLQYLLSIGLWQAVVVFVFILIIARPGREKVRSDPSMLVMILLLAVAVCAVIYFKMHIQNLVLIFPLALPAFVLFQFLGLEHPVVKFDHSGFKILLCAMTGILLLLPAVKNGSSVTARTQFEDGIVNVSVCAKGKDNSLTSIEYEWCSDFADSLIGVNLISTGGFNLDDLTDGDGIIEKMRGEDESDSVSESSAETEEEGSAMEFGTGTVVEETESSTAEEDVSMEETDGSKEEASSEESGSSASEDTSSVDEESKYGNSADFEETIPIEGGCLIIVTEDANGVITKHSIYFPKMFLWPVVDLLS